MTQAISAIASSMLTNAAATATAIAGGTTTAEVEALSRLLTVLASRPDLVIPAMTLAQPGDQRQILPS